MRVEDVVDHDSFIAFLAAFRRDLGRGASHWQNLDLGSYLEGMQAGVAAWPDRPAEANPWRHAAWVLHMGAIYE